LGDSLAATLAKFPIGIKGKNIAKTIN